LKLWAIGNTHKPICEYKHTHKNEKARTHPNMSVLLFLFRLYCKAKGVQVCVCVVPGVHQEGWGHFQIFHPFYFPCLLSQGSEIPDSKDASPTIVLSRYANLKNKTGIIWWSWTFHE
jgi:hypothetical protein